MNKSLHGFIVFVLLTISKIGIAQPDSVLTLAQAKERLLKKNFYLLAAYYEVSQAEAQVIQARLWNNPNINYGQEVYNKNKEILKTSNEYEVQLTQTISIAGKHTNTVKLARVNLEMNKAQFADVVRSLLFELGDTYNNLAKFEEKEDLYNEVLTSYERLITTSKKELSVGAISVTENLRIQSEYIGVKAQALDNANQKEQYLSQLRTLLQYPKDTTVRVVQRIPVVHSKLMLDSLIDHALMVRPDLKVSNFGQLYQEQNLRLQRSLAMPDLTLGYDHDLAGNYIPNYNAVTIQMDLPMFNRNQGNIKQAKYGIQQSQLQGDYLKVKITNQVIAAYNQYKKNYDGLSNYTDEYLDNLTQLNKNTNTYFQKRDISLLEFIDYQRIYISTNIQLIELRQLFLNSVNNLNFSVGETIIEY